MAQCNTEAFQCMESKGKRGRRDTCEYKYWSELLTDHILWLLDELIVVVIQPIISYILERKKIGALTWLTFNCSSELSALVWRSNSKVPRPRSEKISGISALEFITHRREQVVSASKRRMSIHKVFCMCVYLSIADAAAAATTPVN